MRLTEGLGLQTSDSPVRPTSYWRVSSRVEDHLLTGQNESVYIRSVFWILLSISVVYVIAFLRRPSLSDEIAWILHLKGYLVIAFINAGLFYIYRRLLNHLHLGPGLKKLRLKIPNEDALPVRITITQNDGVTGIDEGYMWLEDGTIFYKGRQTVFRLNRDDVPPLSTWPKRDRPNPGMNKLPDTLLIPVENRLLKLHFSILDSHEDFGTRRKAHLFQSNLLSWLKNRPEGSLESLLPPTDLHPGFQTTRTSREPLYAAAVLTAANAVIIGAMNIGVNFSATTQGFAILCTLLHIVLFAFSLKLLISATKTLRIRTDLEKNLKTL
ncbi:hypothetical protein C0431_04990 [bacterium]|nr:hypothetical protein [bacterium]